MGQQQYFSRISPAGQAHSAVTENQQAATWPSFGWASYSNVCGVVTPSTAKVFNHKDGSGTLVCVRHEWALQPGLVVFEGYPDLKDGKMKLDGENVVEFPKLPEIQQVTLRVLRWEGQDKRMIIKEAERLH